MAELVYNRSSKTLILKSNGGGEIGRWRAHNNAQRSSRGPFPLGTYAFSWYSRHAGGTPNSRYGSYGNFIFDVPGRTGMGVHSGRATSTDGAGRKGTAYATNGCIRTSDAAMRTIKSTHGSDPITQLTVE